MDPTHPHPQSPPPPSTPKKRPAPVVDDFQSPTAISQRILEGSPTKTNKYTGCNCSKSHCLKMYCMCFAVGRICDHTCLCQGCKNLPDNMERSEAIYDIICRDPLAFSRKVAPLPDSHTPCNCRKSNCAKKYCDCFKHGRKCTSLCRCVDCHNPQPTEERVKEQESEGAPSKMVKVE